LIINIYYEIKKIISWEYPKDIEEESEVFNQKVEKSDDEDGIYKFINKDCNILFNTL